ncbi:MAG: T9SS type A sorting domain-containing protein [Bacteroidia bacterium]
MKMRSVSDSTIGDEITLLSASWGGDMSYSAGDALNLGGTFLDFSIICSYDQKLAIKTINHWGSWLVPLYMVSCTQGDYFFDISINSNNNGPSVQFELIDNFNNSKKVLKNGDRIFYKITADSNSFRAGRFFLNSLKKNVGLEGQNRLMQNWVIYPNPANKDDEISLVNSMGLVGNLSILDSKGSQIYNKQYNQGNFVEKINLIQLNLPAGVYFIHFLNNGTKSTLRFIVKEN